MTNNYIELKLLDFNYYDTIDEDNYNKYKDSKKFVVQMFGLNEKRETFSIIIDDFKPYFYIEVGNDWKHQDKNNFVSHFRTKLGNYYENSIVDVKFIKRKKLYMFDNGKYYKFIKLIFANNSSFNKAKNLWYNSGKNENGEYSRSLKKNGYEYKTNNKTYYLKLYEAQIPPLLRLFHRNNLSPSGWIKFNKEKSRQIFNKTTYCNYEFNVNYKLLEAMPEKNTLVPYKILSFDIEASSSHGDFPIPIKDYKKLADDLLQYNNFSKNDFDEQTLRRAILTAFEYDDLDSINKVYTKYKISLAQINNLIDTWLSLNIIEINKLKSNNVNYDEDNESNDEEDSDDDANDDVVEKNINEEFKFIPKKIVRNYKNRNKPENNVKIIDILNDHSAEYKSKMKILIKSFYIFPQLEGDKTTFIGYTFKNYGQKQPYLKYCGILNGCVIEKNMDNIKTTCFNNEKDLLLDFAKMINKEDPDIIIGYNITGFDYDFMYKRAQELNCLDGFLKLSRNKDEICYQTRYDWKKKEEIKSITKTNIVLAAGTFNLKYIKMNGRLNIDLFNYYRREFQLPRYKLDYVANYFIGDDVIEYKYENDNTIIKSKNLSGLELYSFIHFEEIGYSNNFYKDGAKFEINDINYNEKTFVISGVQDFDKSKKLRWGLAKDDVTHHDIFRLTNGSDTDRGIVAKYCIKDCKLVDDLLDKSDVITSYVEMANICSVPIDFIHFRGQGIKLTSYVSKKCQEKETLMPVLDKVEDDGGFEGAIVLEPKTKIYLDDPVACTDYSSLYPSSMISENISHDSKVWTKEYDNDGNLINETGYKDHSNNYIFDNLENIKYVDIKYDTFEYIRKTPKAAATKVKCGYKICRFAQFPDNKKAIMPSILEELLAARKYTRKQIPLQTDEFMKNVLDKRQLSIKVTANSLYGQTGARTSSFYEKDVAASTTATGRKLLIYGKTVIEECFYDKLVTLNNGDQVKTYAEYVYGDTDSVFFKFNLKTADDKDKIIGREALAITIELAKRAGELASKFLKPPHDLEYEKTFWPWCLLSKKRYDGILYEDDPNKGKRKFMGNVLKRRDNAAIVKDIYGETMHILLQEKDIKKSLTFVRSCMEDIIAEKYPMDKLIVCKSLRGYYKNPNQIAHKVLAERIGIREPGNKPGAGDRIDYVYIKNSNKKALQGEKIETPRFIKENNIPIDYGHYITNQIMKPLQQLFALELENIHEYKIKYPTSRKWDDQVNKIKEKYPDPEKFQKKYEELRSKEIKLLIFDEYIKRLQ
jgi:DNA polymerase elongation subunit (family B)